MGAKKKKRLSEGILISDNDYFWSTCLIVFNKLRQRKCEEYCLQIGMLSQGVTPQAKEVVSPYGHILPRIGSTLFKSQKIGDCRSRRQYSGGNPGVWALRNPLSHTWVRWQCPVRAGDSSCVPTVTAAAVADQQWAQGPQFITSCSLHIGGFSGAGHKPGCLAWLGEVVRGTEGRDKEMHGCERQTDRAEAGVGRISMNQVFGKTSGNRSLNPGPSGGKRRPQEAPAGLTQRVRTCHSSPEPGATSWCSSQKGMALTSRTLVQRNCGGRAGRWRREGHWGMLSKIGGVNGINWRMNCRCMIIPLNQLG